MRLTSRFGVAITVALVLAITHQVCAGPTISLRFDPAKPNKKSAPVWLGYLMSRAVYRERYKLPTPASGEVVPSFGEEVEARSAAAQIYREFKTTDRKLKDPYWELLSEVDRRGFMGAYAWTFLRRAQWPPTDLPSNLAAFEIWRKKALPNHKPQTHGSLEAR